MKNSKNLTAVNIIILLVQNQVVQPYENKISLNKRLNTLIYTNVY
jgi:hypothetical protein